MSELELTEHQQLDISMTYGTLFALSMCNDYLDGIKPILTAKRAKNLHSKALFLEADCNSFLKAMQYEFLKSMNKEQQQVFLQSLEIFKELCYSLLGLSVEQQDKVREIISQLANES